MLIVSLDQYIGVVALPEIGRALGYSAQTLQAVINAYAVASAGFLLLGGPASDLFGRQRNRADTRRRVDAILRQIEGGYDRWLRSPLRAWPAREARIDSLSRTRARYFRRDACSALCRSSS
jgi:hypothetical protein